MNKVDKKKLENSIKIYPLFYGLSADLIFWIAINTLFLTTVKGLSASQINSLSAFSTFFAIIFQLFIVKIVRKIGRLNSVRVGTILLFLSPVLYSISTKYIWFLIANICYCVGFVFKQIDNVILIKDLEYLNMEDEYINIQTKGSTIYSLATLIISLISGFLFNINPYIPMIICMIICFINIILSNYLYEVPNTKKENILEHKKIPISKNIIITIILYGLFYSLVEVSQSNSKLFMQLNMQEFLKLDKVAIYMSIFITISRIIRLISNLMFIKIYNKLKNKILYLFHILLMLSYILLLLGNLYKNNIDGIYIMAIGFCIYLALRDPFENYIRKICFDNSKEEVHDKIVNYLMLTRRIFALIFGFIISLILIKYNYEYVMSILFILSVTFIIIVSKIYNLLSKGDS